jgi:hypothetical protein
MPQHNMQRNTPMHCSKNYRRRCKMPTKEPVPPPPPTGDVIPPLTDDQRLELAACYAEWCGVDPENGQDWRTEMVVAKKWVRQLMTIWARRARKRKTSNIPTSPPPPRKR